MIYNIKWLEEARSSLDAEMEYKPPRFYIWNNQEDPGRLEEMLEQ